SRKRFRGNGAAPGNGSRHARGAPPGGGACGCPGAGRSGPAGAVRAGGGHARFRGNVPAPGLRCQPRGDAPRAWWAGDGERGPDPRPFGLYLGCRSAAACPAGPRKTIPNTGSNPVGATNVVGQRPGIAAAGAEAIASAAGLAEGLTRDAAAVEHALEYAPGLRSSRSEKAPHVTPPWPGGAEPTACGRAARRSPAADA